MIPIIKKRRSKPFNFYEGNLYTWKDGLYIETGHDLILYYLSFLILKCDGSILRSDMTPMVLFTNNFDVHNPNLVKPHLLNSDTNDSFQVQCCICHYCCGIIDPSHKSHNALDKYPIMHHFVTEMCTHVHISVPKWCIVEYGLVHCGICATGLLDNYVWYNVVVIEPMHHDKLNIIPYLLYPYRGFPELC